MKLSCFDAGKPGLKARRLLVIFPNLEVVSVYRQRLPRRALLQFRQRRPQSKPFFAFSVSYGYGDPGYSETVIELNHAFKVNPHFLLQPVLQIIVGTGIPTATVLGIQSTTDF